MSQRLVGRNSRAAVIMTRVPVPGFTKTRMMPQLNGQRCAALHACFLRDQVRACLTADADVIIAFTPEDERDALYAALPANDFNGLIFVAQSGDDLGGRLRNVAADVFASGYEELIILGSDIPEIAATHIDAAFDALNRADVVLGPTFDGGYYLIGMRRLHKAALSLERYGHSRVLEQTREAIRNTGLTEELLPPLSDIDTFEDACALVERSRNDVSGALASLESVAYLNPLCPALGKPSISVIVPVLNEEMALPALLEQLRPYADEVQVVFVDGGSTDATASMIDPCFTLVRSKKGRGSQLNAGAAQAQGDILLFLHADSVLPDGFVDEVRSVAKSHRVGCFGIRFPRKQPVLLLCQVLSNLRVVTRGLAYGDQGIFVRREVFERLGGFRDLPIMEDLDFSMRMRQAGIKPRLARGRIVTSDRRFGDSMAQQIDTWRQMASLRKRFLSGEDAGLLAVEYRNAR